MTARELEEGGMQQEMAQLVAGYLQESLQDSVQRAVAVKLIP